MPLDTSDLPVRQLGNYELLAKVAEGGMGAVYRGRNTATGDIVAVKVIAPTTAKNPVLLQRFEREFLAAKVLDHPNVVRAIDYCGTGPHPFLVMEFVDGESLGQRMARDGSVPEAEAVRLIAQVCDGLQRAHKQGLIHRDVKPDNIMITLDGVAKLTDMGLVKNVDEDLNLTKTGRGLGTPHFMAPEQFRNAKHVDVRSDIYSLGATLYAALTGTIPFNTSSPLDCWMKKIRNEFPSPKALNPAVSDRIDWAVRRAMSADPGQRPASCREFVEDLTGQGRGGPAPGPADSQPIDRWYLVYRDETGQTHTVKGTTEGVRQALQDGLLGDASNVLVSRTKAGQFVALKSVPEFRDLVIQPEAMPPPGTRTPGSGVYTGPASTGSGARTTVNRPPATTDDGAVDIGRMPSGPVGMPASRNASLSGRLPPLAGLSGRLSPPSARIVPDGRSGRYDPRLANAETAPHNPTPTPIAAARAAAAAARSGPLPPQPPPPPAGGGPRVDWLTPLLVFLVGALSATVAFLLLKR